MKPDIEIKCPQCSGKAAFFSSKVIRSTKLVPDLDGKVVCVFCGLNKAHYFTCADYYYSIPVDKRFLYARTMEDLKTLLTYFRDNKRLKGDPELDFPKEFYENRLVIVNRIENRIKEELKKSQ